MVITLVTTIATIHDEVNPSGHGTRMRPDNPIPDNPIPTELKAGPGTSNQKS